MRLLDRYRLSPRQSSRHHAGRCVVFGIHVPKTAGSTFLKMSRRRLGARLYQNTSQLKNFETGRPSDLFSIADPASIRMVFGHHVYETSLQFFQPYMRSFFTLTFLREPLARLHSQFDFDARLAKVLAIAPPDEEEFLQRNANAICSFFITRFPSLAGARGSLSQRAQRVLSAFDCVLPHDAIRRGFAAASRALDMHPTWLGLVPRINPSTGAARLRSPIQLLRQQNAEDLALYEAFELAQRARPEADNPLASSAEDARMSELVARRMQASQHIAHVAPSLALELVNARGPEDVVERCLQLKGLERECLQYGLSRLGVVVPSRSESAV
jgi:hypothetical protein